MFLIFYFIYNYMFYNDFENYTVYKNQNILGCSNDMDTLHTEA